MAGGGRKHFDTHTIEIPSGAVSFDPEGFNEFLNLHGVRLVHYKALRCPVGMTDIDDNRRPHDDHSGCSNGFIYYKAGVVTAGMQGNGNQQLPNDLGLIENSYITATIPQYYDQSEETIDIAPFDRFYLDENEPAGKILVPTWHLQTAHGSGIDKLYYPAVEVEKLVDMNNESYKCGADFTIENGQIKWDSRRPGYQLDVGRGAIYSIRYKYRPYWYCTRLLHEIRVAQVETLEGRVLARMPQQILLAREYTYTNESADSQATDSNSLRQTPSPNDGGWGSSR
jgi:hypothetical protein